MNILNSYSGFLFFAFFIYTSCKRNEESKSSATFSEAKDANAIALHDSLPRFAVYSSADEGNSWQPMSQGLPDNLQATCLGKVGKELVMGTENAGLFITENNKTAWKDIGNGLASKKINTLYVSGNEIYIGLYHEGVTMWKTDSPYWNAYNSNLPNRNVQAIVKVGDELVVGTDMGIFKSTDHIQSWTGKHIGEQCVSLNMTGDTLYAGTVKGVMMSKDAGETWNYVHKGGAIHTTILQDRKIFASYTSGDLFMSDNWGRSWKEIVYSPGKQSYVNSLIKAVGNIIMSNKDGVFRSSNSGRQWELIFPAERFVFVGFVEDGDIVYGVTRSQ